MMDAVQYSPEGLLILIKCLNLLLDNLGRREQLIDISKKEIMITYESAKNYLPVVTIHEQLKISNQKMFRLRVSEKCLLSTFQHCMKLCPTQLSLIEQSLIRKYVTNAEFENLPVNHLWADAQRHGLYISKDTFYKYVRKIRGKQVMKVKEEEIKKTRVEASKVFEIIHMDSTTFKCLNGERVYIHFIMDNFSRNVLGAVPSHSSKSNVVAQNLKEVIAKFNLYTIPFTLYSDDGPENHGEVTKLLNQTGIVKIVANYSTEQSNNMIEAWNKKFKQIILRKFKAKSFENLKAELPKMVDYFNNLPLPVLKTLTPNEIVSGAKYEDLEVRIKMDQAKIQRLNQNRILICNLKDAMNTGNFNCNKNNQIPKFPSA
jgi:putative transposase